MPVMLFLRMVLIAVRLAWPYVFTPWRSPLLRWRMETYGIRDEHGRLLHAAEITRGRFLTFAVSHRTALVRFLRWATLL